MWVVVASALIILLSGQSALAQTTPTDVEALAEAVRALESEEYQAALEALDRAQPNELDARVNYYRGFAFEKLGECAAASRQYEIAARDSERPRLQKVSREALDGFQSRCKPVSVNESNVTEPVVVSAPSNVGWQIFGWVALTLGTMSIVAVPVKNSIESSALEQATPYFEERYACEVDRDQVTGAKCDRAGLESDSAYSDYQDRVALADRTSTYLLIGGVATAGVGLATILTVALTGSAPVTATIAPRTDGGVAGSIGFKF